jgi:hypothetical protein
MRKKVLIISQIALVVLIAAAGIFIFFTHRAAGVGNTTLADQQAALEQTIDGMNVRGVLVPVSWSIKSMQLAPHPEQLPQTRPNPGNVQQVWCAVITPPVIIQKTPRFPEYSLSRFVVVESGTQWVAYTVDDVQPEQGQAVFTALGCTNS